MSIFSLASSFFFKCSWDTVFHLFFFKSEPTNQHPWPANIFCNKKFLKQDVLPGYNTNPIFSFCGSLKIVNSWVWSKAKWLVFKNVCKSHLSGSWQVKMQYPRECLHNIAGLPLSCYSPPVNPSVKSCYMVH